MSSNKSKTTWQLVNKLRGVQRKQPFNVKDFNGQYESNEEIVTNMNNYFIDGCQNTKTDNSLPTGGVKYISETFSLYLTTEDEVRAAIATLSNSKAMGIDEIPSSLLKICSDSLAGPFTHMINQSFGSGSFPDALKRTIIKSIHKKVADQTSPTIGPLR